jgi:ABC-type phosphate transport system permease subunit
MIGILFTLLILALLLASMWKIFEKAGRQGWEGIVPIYNSWVMAEIVGKPGWWGLLTLVPVVGIFVGLYLLYLLTKSFGLGIGFFIGMLLLGIVFIPMLAFGDAQYQGIPEDELLENL